MSEFVAEECYKCGVRFGLTGQLSATVKRDKQTFYCPNGHGQVYGTCEADKLRLERDRLKQQLAQKDDEIADQRARREASERRVSATKGQVTRLNNRAAAGVCPCCNRSFVALARHMQTKHPKFTAEEVAPDGATVQ